MKKELLQQALDALKFHTRMTRPISHTNEAIAALEAAIALPVALQPLTDRWMQWTGDYEKQSYDVWVKGCDVVLGCWPNAGFMSATDNTGRHWQPSEVLAVRVSDFQGRFPKPKFAAHIKAKDAP